MNLRDFEYMAALGKHKTISKASKELYISQPALSKFLQKTEQELGVCLFQRIGRHLVPTYAGTQCIKTSSEILRIYDKMAANMADIAKQEQGQIKVGLPMSRSNYFISRILPVFHQQYPQICISIYENNTQTLLKRLRLGELNLVFANVTEMHDDLQYFFVDEEEMVLAAPRSFHLEEKSTVIAPYHYPCLKPEDWCALPFLMLNQDQMSRKYANEYMKKHGITPNIFMEVRSLDRILYSVRQGLGITICPSMPLPADDTADEIAYFSLFSENGPTIRKTAVIACSDAYLSIAEKMLIQLIKDSV